MQKLHRSRHLLSRKNGTKYRITRLDASWCLHVDRDLVDLIDCFGRPVSAAEVGARYNQDDVPETIERLKTLGFLVSAETGEETEILGRWQERLGGLKELFPAGDSAFRAYGTATGAATVSRFRANAEPIKQQLDKELFPFQRRIFTLFLQEEEYAEVARQYGLSPRTLAFVDAKSLLILNSRHLPAWMEREFEFRRSIKHELIHLLLGQQHYYIPAWIEEGLCELYSGQLEHTLDQGLLARRRRTYSFTDAEALIINSIRDLEDSPLNRSTVYAQACSFVQYLIEQVGAESFWRVIAETGIRVNFREIFRRITGRELGELEQAWVALVDSRWTATDKEQA